MKKHIIQKHLIDHFENEPLKSFDKFALQVHLNSLAKANCRDTVLQIRAYIRDIFAEAVDQDFLVEPRGKGGMGFSAKQSMTPSPMKTKGTESFLL